MASGIASGGSLQQKNKASGATTTITKAIALRDYRLRLRDNLKSLRDNFAELIKLAKVEDEHQVARLTQFAHEQYEMQVRAANMVRAAESLLKLVSDLKQFLILNDFAFVNETVAASVNQCQLIRSSHDNQLAVVKEDAAAFLFEVEQEFYNSTLRR